MPQSLAKLHTHLIFSTKDRQPVIPDDLRARLHEYMGGILHGLDCQPIEINSEPDHVHLLFLLARIHSVAKIVGELKEDSSKWLKKSFDGFMAFHWQRGYAIFSVSASNVEAVRTYIRNQREHHRKLTFQDEVRALLEKHQLEYDERYVWD
jgi:REP element-mobilizing transposase RayT